MAAQLIDGRQLAEQIKGDVRRAIAAAVACGRRRPGLAVVKVGDDPASAVYVRGKRRACEEVGIISLAYDLPAPTPESERSSSASIRRRTSMASIRTTSGASLSASRSCVRARLTV